MEWKRRVLMLAVASVAVGALYPGYRLLLSLEIETAVKTATEWEEGTTMLWLLFGSLFLLVLLTVFLPLVFNRLKLTDSAQALGLPEGSVRAILALVLIALFAASPIYLYSNMSGSERTRSGLDDSAKAKFAEDYKAQHPVFDQVANGTWTARYWEPPDPAEVDFAKQMLVLLGTLATSVTSFYFGAKVATSASAQGAGQAGGAPPAVKPGLRALTTEPTPLPPRAANGSIAFKLHLTGSGLNNVKSVKLASGKDQFTFPSRSNDTEATCDVACTPTVATGANWDISVIDGVGTESDPLRAALTF